MFSPPTEPSESPMSTASIYINDTLSNVSNGQPKSDEMELDPPDAAYTRKRSRSYSFDESTDEDSFDCKAAAALHPRKRFVRSRPEADIQHGRSTVEYLPRELLHKIGTCLASDQELASLSHTSRKLAYTLLPHDSSVWKTRFLAKYDYPILDSESDFCNAYKLRRFVLSNFVDFRNGKDPRLAVQMDIVKDMILETYHKPAEYLPTPTTSRNLTAFNFPSISPWLITFLSSPFFNFGQQKNAKGHDLWIYGEPHALFDALHLVFSHLLLSPGSRIAYHVSASRDNYDIVKVYNWNRPFATLFSKSNLDQKVPATEAPKLGKSKVFPTLFRSGPKPAADRPINYKLDTNTLLHIRNFWYRHLIDADSTKRDAVGISEATYAHMAHDLKRLGHFPGAWEAPLQDPNANLDGILNHKWFGHYTSMQPWPKKSSDLAERQTTAEDWTGGIDPLTLDWTTSTSDPDGSTWPPIFSSIPAFQNTTPDEDEEPNQRFYLRGIAPFLDIKTALQNSTQTTNPSSSSDTQPDHSPSSTPNTSSLPKYHPYLSLRLRGLLHPIPSTLTASIPGFRRICFVLYAPTPRYLIHVLEHAAGDYGSTSNLLLSQHLLNTLTDETVQAILSGDTQALQTQIDPLEADRHLRKHLRRLLSENPREFGLQGPESMMTRDGIARMEDKRSGGQYLSWEDVEYAYAYEGVVVPGGKIMLGRWWRCGLVGEGEGKEVDVEGLSVVVQEEGREGVVQVEVAGEEMGVERMETRASKGLDRGAFCFWT